MSYSSGIAVDDLKVWQFFPSTTPVASGKFNYGSNRIRTYINDEEAPESLQLPTFTLRDFPYFSLGTTSFVNTSLGQQSQGYQGRNTWVMGSIGQTPEGQLTNGTVAVLND